MYVNERTRPLTFTDLVKATQRSAGLGQDDLSSLPVQSPALSLGSQNIDPYDLQLSSIATGGPVTTGGVPVSSASSWGSIALIAGAVLAGVFLIKGIAK